MLSSIIRHISGKLLMPAAYINHHTMHYEIHGDGEPLICSGGWGTYCHGAAHHLPRGLTERYRVVIFDHRGIAQSTDDPATPATTALYADDVIALLQHLGIARAHFVGIIGIGACIFQEVAIRRPDLVRSLVNTGTWARADKFFHDQLTLWLDVHRGLGFEAFQRMVVMEAFSAEFYAAHHAKLLGPDGGWSELRDNIITHQRLTEAALSHDTLDRLDRIQAPTLVVHQGRDFMTAPRLTLPVEHGIPNARGYMMAEASHVVTGREAKKEFCEVLLGFLAQC
jgi:pimeloyl-ACP methyl ester carboxylesterase